MTKYWQNHAYETHNLRENNTLPEHRGTSKAAMIFQENVDLMEQLWTKDSYFPNCSIIQEHLYKKTGEKIQNFFYLQSSNWHLLRVLIADILRQYSVQQAALLKHIFAE